LPGNKKTSLYLAGFAMDSIAKRVAVDSPRRVATQDPSPWQELFRILRW
jgi:hypothetical protein